MVENDIFFLHNVFFTNFRNQLPIVKNVFHVYPLEVLTIKSFSSNNQTTQLTLL